MWFGQLNRRVRRQRKLARPGGAASLTAMDDFIHFAYRLDASGAPAALDRTEDIVAALRASHCAWVHLQSDHPEAAAWIEDNLGYLPEAVRDALTADITRPRVAPYGDGVLLNLRGVNHNPGAEPEDMISIRIWADPARVVTLTRRPLTSVEEMRADVVAGTGPASAGSFLAMLIERITAKITAFVSELDTDADEFENRVLRGEEAGLGARITDARAAVVDVRRFLVPQRDAVARLLVAPEGLFSANDRLELEEAEDDLRRQVETIESLRERLIVLRDELASLSDARLNRNLYIVSIVSAVFLPLGFLTGLMGINLAGMPGAEWPPAFWVFTGLCGVILVLVLLLLWRLHLIRPR